MANEKTLAENYKDTGAEEVDMSGHMGDNGQFYDLDNSKDMEDLSGDLGTGGMYFKPEEGKTYKVTLQNKRVIRVEKDFDGDKQIKYQLNITARGSDKSEFDGVWEVGRGIMRTIKESIIKDNENNPRFNVSKTGTGIKTRYSVNRDF